MPETFRAKVRNVGTSLGILMPKEVAKKEGVKVGEEVQVTIMKPRAKNLKELWKLFGSAKGAEPFEREHKDRF